MPAVSLVLPVFNVAPWLEQFLASLRAQTLEDYELVAVDDASRDESRAILLRAAAADRRIRVVLHAENRGVAIARATAMSEVTGRYVAMVDPDDWMAPERLARMVGRADAHGLDWLADNQWIHRDGSAAPLGSLLVDEPAGLARRDLRYIIERDPPGRIGYGTLKPLIRRSFLERSGITFPTHMNRCDDFLFLVTIGATGARLHLLNEPLYHYRLRPGSEVTAMSWRQTMTAMHKGNDEAIRIVGPGGDPALLATLERRRQAISDFAAFAEATQALRGGALARGLATLAARPMIWPLVVRRGAAWLARTWSGADPLVGALAGSGLCSVAATKLADLTGPVRPSGLVAASCRTAET